MGFDWKIQLFWGSSWKLDIEGGVCLKREPWTVAYLRGGLTRKRGLGWYPNAHYDCEPDSKPSILYLETNLELNFMVEDSTPAAATCSSTPAVATCPSTPAVTTCKNCSVLQAKITEHEHQVSVMNGTRFVIIVLFCGLL